MTPDDLFEASEGSAEDWFAPSERLNTALLQHLRRGPVEDVADVDVAEALALLLHSDFMAYGTNGGQRLTDPQARLVLRALRATVARLGLTVKIPWQDFTSFRSYWIANGGHGSWGARRVMVGEVFDPLLARLYQLADEGPAGTVPSPALDALTDPAAITEHLRRLATCVDSDPRLAVSVAKDLVESTAKLVLRERGVAYTAKEDLPALVARAQQALRLAASGVADDTDEAKALKTILGSLTRLTQGVTELRNQVGVGHGRESVPTWVRPRHARLAAGAATTWCNLMLETLGDPEAPWRATLTGGDSAAPPFVRAESCDVGRDTPTSSRSARTSNDARAFATLWPSRRSCSVPTDGSGVE